MAVTSPAAVVQSLPWPAFTVDRDGTISHANEPLLELIGSDGTETSGRGVTVLEGVIDVGFETLAGAVDATLGNGTKNSISVALTRRDGTNRRLRGDVLPIVEGEQLVGALVVFREAGRDGGERRERRFHRAFERHNAPMLLIDPDSGRIEDVNDAAVSFYGYDQNELTSMRIQEINCLTPEEVAHERERARRESRNHFNFEHELASGEIRPVEVHSSPITLDDGEVLFSIIHDISEREAHKTALERQQAFTDSALNALTDIFYVVDRSGRLQRWNDRVSEVTGYEDDELQDMPITELFHPEDRERVAEAVADVFEDGGQVTSELTIETKSGKRIPHEFTGVLLHVDGEPVGVAGVGRDITERRAREQDLRQLRRAIEATPHAVFLTDSDGQIEYANPAFEAMTGYAKAEAVGRTPRILKSDQHDREFYGGLWETITAGEIWQDRIVNARRSGELYHAHQTIAPIIDEHDVVTGFVAIQTDVTDREERQQHFRVLSRVLRHNLQNDLSVVRSYAEQIGDTCEHDDAVDKIVDKTDDILGTARKEREIAQILSEEMHRRERDVGDIVDQALTDARHEYPEAAIRGNVSTEATAITTLRLRAAIVELIENAIVHNDEGVTVSVSIDSTPDTVTVSVTDDGTGIPESEQQILETGTEIDPLYHGTGLGLWLVYWIVRRSGGTLDFSENDPHGSVVTITLDRERPVETTGYVVER